MGFSRQEYWSGLPFPPAGNLSNPGTEPGSPAFQVDSLPSEPPGKLHTFLQEGGQNWTPYLLPEYWTNSLPLTSWKLHPSRYSFQKSEVILDSSLHITCATTRKSCTSLRNESRIQPLLTTSTTTALSLSFNWIIAVPFYPVNLLPSLSPTPPTNSEHSNKKKKSIKISHIQVKDKSYNSLQDPAQCWHVPITVWLHFPPRPSSLAEGHPCSLSVGCSFGSLP